MTLATFSPGVDTNFSTELNNNFNDSLTLILQNHTRTLIDRTGVYSKDSKDLWGEAYIDSDGRNNGVNTTNTTATFTSNYYTTNTEVSYVIIEASSLVPSNFSVNNCLCKQFDTGKWILYCTTGTNAVKRASIYATLFSNGLATSITGLTALKTSIARDVGKRGFKRSFAATFADTNAATLSVTDTFSDTTNNTSCSAWSNLMTSGAATFNFKIPSGTTRNTVNNSTSNEIGTDLEADENNNPASMVLEVTKGGSSGTPANSATAIVLSSSTIVKGTPSITGNVTAATDTLVDYYTTYSVPAFTTVGSTNPTIALIEHTIPAGTFSSTCSKMIAKALVGSWETGDTIYHRLQNASEDTGFVADGQVISFTAFTSQPTKITTKLVPKSSPTSGYPAVFGMSVYAV